MMKIASLLLLFCSITLTAVEIPFSQGEIEATLETTGGAISNLTYKGQKMLAFGNSFSERIVANCPEDGKPRQWLERFDLLQFTPEILESGRNRSRVLLSARGIGAFDWLRLSKTYTLQSSAPVLEVEYRLENLSEQPRTVGVWARTFLRSCQDPKETNVFYQTRADKSVELLHPGGVQMDEWSLEPQRGLSAVGGKNSNFGAVLEAPLEFLDSFYNWYSIDKHYSTLEFLLREQTLSPGQAFVCSVKVTFTDDLLKLVRELERQPLPTPVQAKGERLLASSYYARGKERELITLQSQDGVTTTTSRRSLNLLVPRQFSRSVRAVKLPDDADLASIAVYEAANGRADYSREVPSKVESDGQGGKRLLFTVPGLERSFFAVKLDQQGVFRNAQGEFLALQNYPVQVCLDRAAQQAYPADLFSGGPDLLHNGDFSRVSDSIPPWPAGFPTAMAVRNRNWYSYRDGALHITRPSEDQRWVQFNAFFLCEPNHKYHASARVRNDNKIRGVAAGSISFLDADLQDLPEAKISFYPGNREAHDWKTFNKHFYAPEKAVFGKMTFVLYGVREQTLSLDDLQIVPDDYSTQEIKLRDRLRDQLLSSWYNPLEFIESNSSAVETEHVKWLKPSAFDLPELLFLPMVRGNYSTLERRLAVELEQRLDYRWQMVPLLARVARINGSGIMGVYSNTILPELEPYTQECLNEAPQYKVILLHEVDFQKDVGEEFLTWLSARAENSSLLFSDCLNIPAALLGTAVAVPPELSAMPLMRNVSESNFAKFLHCHQRGALRSASINLSSSQSHHNPTVPSQDIGNRYPGFVGRDFPFWEYNYLTLAKLLRWVSGVLPEALLTQPSPGQAAVNCTQPFNAELELVFENLWRQETGRQSISLPLQTGVNAITWPSKNLPGGSNIAKVFLKRQGKILDAAAYHLELPQDFTLKVDFPDGRRGGIGRSLPIVAEASSSELELTLRIEDADFRVLAQASGRGSVRLDFLPQAPYSTLYRALLSGSQGGRVRGQACEEFIIAGRTADPQELTAVIWPANSSFKYSIYRQLGFDQAIVWCRDNRQAVRALRNVNIEPTVYGIGSTSFGNWTTYKDDKKSDPVRTPCFSSSEAQEQAAKNIADICAKNDSTALDVKYHFVGDEQFIGSSVCFSPDCLREFRAVLQQQYGTVERLNAEWGSAFASFAEVMPVQLQELTNKARLGAFVDHKVFMNRVFAEQYLGNLRQYLKSAVPDSIIGLSGTVNPGYSFDWALVLRQLDYLAYYDGIQRKLVQDLARPEMLAGQWFGGYVAPTHRSDGYINSFFWRDLLSGARLSPFYAPRAGITGELLLTPCLEEYQKLLTEARSGLARLVFNSQLRPRVAMLYSQTNFFVAAGTVGANEFQNALSGWHALLGDLGIDYRFIYAPELPEKLSSEYQALILPCCLAMSEAELAAVEKFLEAGGTVLSDFDFGAYNEHGTLREGRKVPDIASVTHLGQEFRSSDISLPLQQSRKIGRGRVCQLNFLLGGYQQVVLSGTGGEVSSAVSGADQLCQAMRQIVSEELAQAGATSDRLITDAEGQLVQAETCWREFKGNYLLGVWKTDSKAHILDETKAVSGSLTLPRSGHLYDVRAGRYLGQGDRLNLQIIPGGAGLYAVLANKIESVQLEHAPTLARGETLSFKVAVQAGAAPGGHVFHCRLSGPDRHYSVNLTAPAGQAEGKLQLAFNDAPGTWRLEITDVNSGVKTSSEVLLK